MNHATYLKNQINTKTAHMVLLSVATLGIYLIIWLVKNKPIVETTTQHATTGQCRILWIAICHAWVFALPYLQIVIALLSVYPMAQYRSYYSHGPSGLAIFLGVCWYVLIISYWVFLINWAFKAKKAVQEYVLNALKVDMPINNIYLVLFHLFYINYCINQIPEVVRKHDIIKGSSSTLGDSQ